MRTTSHTIEASAPANVRPSSVSKATESVSQAKRKHRNEPDQSEFVGLIWQPAQLPFRLHAGDVIRYDGRLCRVLRVNECAAVVIMNRPTREFTTRFDKAVRFTPPPAQFRLSPQSAVEIVNLRKYEHR